ncbi:MAG: Uncharacterised protein [Flavobacteriia bacterium]|nr:MAG: Uncharacterised protein [Flavobacteriia bacterium]
MLGEKAHRQGDHGKDARHQQGEQTAAEALGKNEPEGHGIGGRILHTLRHKRKFHVLGRQALGFVTDHELQFSIDHHLTGLQDLDFLRKNGLLTEIQELHFEIGIVLQNRWSDLFGWPDAFVVRTVIEIEGSGNRAIVSEELRV